MKMSKLSNQTNSQDPQAVNSRVFVGNLNTFQCSKTDVERMFQKYGRLAGISMHKGYAFVQFTNPFDARNACHGEDGRTILSQVLDVNMVAEPKPHQIGRKRQNVTKTGNDWDYYYDSYCASTLFSTTSPRPIKRQRLMAAQNRGNALVNNKVNLQQQQQQQIILSKTPIINGNGLQNTGSTVTTISVGNSINANISGNLSANTVNGEQMPTIYHMNGQRNFVGPLKVYSNPDTLICGNCRECFTDLSELLEHKRSYCKLRFTCKCQENAQKTTTLSSTTKLLCALCKDFFISPWDLMVHVQAAHMINIYELGHDATNNNHLNSNNNIISDTSNNNNIAKNDNISLDDASSNKINGDAGGKLDTINMAECIDENRMLIMSANNNRKTQTNEMDAFGSIYTNVSSVSPLPINDIKLIQSPSATPSGSPRPELSSPSLDQTCIVRALTIDSSPGSAVNSPLGIITNPIAIAIGNGTIASQ